MARFALWTMMVPVRSFHSLQKVFSLIQIANLLLQTFLPQQTRLICQNGRLLQRTAFGFGNKLLSFNQKSKGLLTVHHCSTNLDLAQRMQEFDNQLESVTAPQICDQKSKNAQNDYDMTEFKVLKCIIENDYDPLLKQFGIDKKKATFEVERFLGKKLNR